MKNAIKILWFILLAIILTCFSELYKIHISSSRLIFCSYILLFVLGLISWLYIIWRILAFRKKLVVFLQHILANEYETGVKIDFTVEDEVTWLEKLVNKVSDQLRVYDNLRVEKISSLNAQISVLIRNAKEGIIAVDIEKKAFELNPVVQAMFEMEREFISFDSIKSLEENKKFIELFENCVEKDKVIKEGNVPLQFPIRNTIRQVYVKIFPLKDNDENVKRAIIFVNKAA